MLRQTLWVIACLVAYSGCSGEAPLSSPSAIYDPIPREPELDIYLLSFVQDASRFGKPISDDIIESMTTIELNAGLPEQVLGRCVRRGTDGERIIQITPPDMWPTEYPSRDRFKLVVYHELGHCLLNLGHTDTSDMKIMQSPSPLNKEVARGNWWSLLNDLFSQDEMDEFNQVDSQKSPNSFLTGSESGCY